MGAACRGRRSIPGRTSHRQNLPEFLLLALRRAPQLSFSPPGCTPIPLPRCQVAAEVRVTFSSPSVNKTPQNPGLEDEPWLCPLGSRP